MPSRPIPLLVAALAILPSGTSAADPPPPGFHNTPAAAVDLVTAEDRQHWAFRRLARTQAPPLGRGETARTPVDGFVGRRLSRAGLDFSPAADRSTLLRRITLDLHGIPPSPSEQDRFLSDRRPDAWPRLIDRLLASPRFGERWGRHWLDVAGYADTVGFDHVPTQVITTDGKWRYRDYVIDAINDDIEFDRFLREQLAGDEMVEWKDAKSYTPETIRHLVATGFLRTARDQTHEDVGVIPPNYYEVLFDTLDVVAGGLLGLSVKCARCHDHKFDAIPQRDYYRLMAVLMPAYNPTDWRPVFPFDKKVKDRSLPDAGQATKGTAGRIQALFDVGKIPPTFILSGGQYEHPGQSVEPGFLSVLCDTPGEAVMRPPRVPNGSSGRRLALACWLTAADTRASALVSRVLVNRAWQSLFGRGLVATSGDFGVQGLLPSHLQLLEWLCRDFQAHNWRLKPLLRVILNSRTYRQASLGRAGAGQEVDPSNRLLWRMPLRRLESESIRDCLLAVSGRLDSSIGGPPVPQQAHADGRITIDTKKLKRPFDLRRRSVYLLARRGYSVTLLSVFDQPSIQTTCSRRQSSAVTLQSLTMLNGRFLDGQAKALADRVGSAAGDDIGRAILRLYRVVLCRLPDAVERQLCREMLETHAAEVRQQGGTPAAANRQALGELCHTLLNTSEFLYRE